MNKLVVSSIRSNAGKTSIIAGIISSIKNKKFAYTKPLGDRLIYKRKKSWDYDASLIVNLLGREGELESHYEKITLGFDHSKLRYMYDEDGIKKALQEIVRDIGGNSDALFVEAGRNLGFGTSLNLDPISMSKYIDAKHIVVIGGDSNDVLDDMTFLDRYLRNKDVKFDGVIINKVPDIDEFENKYLPGIKKIGIDILGVIPYKEQLTYFTVDFLAEKLLARVLTGEENMKKVVKNIIIGAMSTSDPQKNPLFTRASLNKENQLMITGGDRSDMILAALERDTAAIVLTNDIMPPQNIISKARERGVPLLLIAMDTFQAAKRIDDMEALMTKDNTEKIQLMSQMIEKYTKLKDFLA